MAGELDGLFAECQGHQAEGTRCQPLCGALEKNQSLVFHWLFDVAAGPEALPSDLSVRAEALCH